MDPFKVLGVSESSIKGQSDLEKVRHRSKELYKRYCKEKRESDAKRVEEAFELVKTKIRRRFGASKSSYVPPAAGPTVKPPVSGSKPVTELEGPSPAPVSSPFSPEIAGPSPLPSPAKSLGEADAATTVGVTPAPAAVSPPVARATTGVGGATKTASVQKASDLDLLRDEQVKRQRSSAREVAKQVSSRGGSGTTRPLTRTTSRPELPHGGAGCVGGGTETVLPGTTKRGVETPLPGAHKRARTAGVSSVGPGGVPVFVALSGASKQPARRLTPYVCGCGKTFEPKSLPRCVPTATDETFVCPACRFRSMDPLNPVLDGHRGVLKLLVIQPPLVPKESRTEAAFKFHVNVPKIHLWRKQGHNVEVRMCCLNTFQVSHTWTKSLAFKLNGRQAFKIQAPPPGHKRRDVPKRISAELKPGNNTVEVSVVDPCVQRYALAVVRTCPQLPRQLCKRVDVMNEEKSKLRVHNLLFTSLLEGSGQEVQCAGSDRCRLVCPITLARIETPARGRSCRHLQCFDLQGYLLSNMRMRNYNNRWRCPVCDLALRPPKDLFVDTYLLTILGKTSSEDEEVAFDEEGTWRVTARAPSPAPSSSEDDGGPGRWRFPTLPDTSDVVGQASSADVTTVADTNGGSETATQFPSEGPSARSPEVLFTLTVEDEASASASLVAGPASPGHGDDQQHGDGVDSDTVAGEDYEAAISSSSEADFGSPVASDPYGEVDYLEDVDEDGEVVWSDPYADEEKADADPILGDPAAATLASTAVGEVPSANGSLNVTVFESAKPVANGTTKVAASVSRATNLQAARSGATAGANGDGELPRRTAPPMPAPCREEEIRPRSVQQSRLTKDSECTSSGEVSSPDGEDSESQSEYEYESESESEPEVVVLG
eukprot:TRINITY_DN34789_c0_g1_i1.p1 TRINITY_DN34789_c0_g1~~TRINITY_DN34789_c0_g1_i1.p1  ORF type:complete len:884 (+),score=158.12 TRINITY_DN34789_c0_g1_i1:57-2708(+)